jgi:hypothetical protein
MMESRKKPDEMTSDERVHEIAEIILVSLQRENFSHHSENTPK